MHLALAALFFFAILTLWVPAYWPVTVFQVGVFTLAAVAIVRAVPLPIRLPYPCFPLAFAVAWGLLQWTTGRTAYPFDTQTDIVQWSTYLAVFFTGFTFFQHREARRWFRSAMLWFSFLVAVLATLQTFTSGGKVFWLFPSGYTDFVMGPIVYRNHYAAFIEAVLPIAVYKALARRGRPLLYSAIAAALYASVIASASRAGSVLATAEILVAAGLLWARGRATGRAVGLSLLRMSVPLAAFTAVVGWQRVWERFWVPDPLALRREFAISSLHMISAHPWFGSGLGTWATVYPRYAIVDLGTFANRAHSDWLQWTAEGGIPLALALLTLFLWCLRPAFRSVWGVGVIAVFLHAGVDYPFSRPALGSWVFAVIALLAASARERQSAPSALPASGFSPITRFIRRNL
ncbi:MAG: O-antigen ligase family protein [Acidobacteriia bacterium]|nr:O-antigen ligase family protein [Terriglobia bacterium]